jgi:hypothetical protein
MIRPVPVITNALVSAQLFDLKWNCTLEEAVLTFKRVPGLAIVKLTLKESMKKLSKDSMFKSRIGAARVTYMESDSDILKKLKRFPNLLKKIIKTQQEKKKHVKLVNNAFISLRLAVYPKISFSLYKSGKVISWGNSRRVNIEPALQSFVDFLNLAGVSESLISPVGFDIQNVTAKFNCLFKINLEKLHEKIAEASQKKKQSEFSATFDLEIEPTVSILYKKDVTFTVSRDGWILFKSCKTFTAPSEVLDKVYFYLIQCRFTDTLELTPVE